MSPRAYAPSPPTFQCETRARIGFEDESYRFYTRTPLFIARMFEGRVIKSSRGERAVFAVMRGILFSWKWIETLKSRGSCSIFGRV